MSAPDSTREGCSIGAPGRTGDDPDLFVLGEVGHHDVEHESIELRLGKWIGAFELDRVLRGENEERPIERIRPARGRDVILLHGLQQGRLGLRWRAVDLVRKNHLREDRSGDEAQHAMARLFVEDLRTRDVRRHQVGRELDALEGQVQNLRDGLDEQRLGKTRHACNQTVTAGEQRHQDLIDHVVLADDDLPDLREDSRAARGDAIGDLGDVRF